VTSQTILDALIFFQFVVIISFIWVNTPL